MSHGKSPFNPPEFEEKILSFWREKNIFQKSLDKTKRGKTFVFYEGPPTANGLPGTHHALTRAFKDVVLRYKTMRGFFVPRKAGWDTHGLPVEIEIEKELGLKTKRGIEKYGIARFNQKAKESVWRYKDEWERQTARLGFWLDLDHPYVTYETTYIETLWYIIKEIWKKGLLYQDFKVMPWCPRCETGLSSHEVGLGYKKVREDSIYVKLRLKNHKNVFLLIWTTTPWTLPANVAVAVHPGLEYTKFKIGNEFIWSASPPPYDKGVSVSVVEKAAGRSLMGLQYEPLFHVPKEYSLGKIPEYNVISAEFVSLEEGTGMVHLAPAFGEEDMNTVKLRVSLKPNHSPKHRKDLIDYSILHTVNQDGTIKRGVIGEGKFVKEADKIIIEDLRERKLLHWIQSYEHDYPFCWRCSAPLLYFAKTAWWIRVSALKNKLLAANSTIRWIPEHIKEGRVGEFLRDVRDWAFSRERYWGTPLPLWKCEGCDKIIVPGSREELAGYAAAPRNRYFIMRHGESLTNVKSIISFSTKDYYPLTMRGKLQIEGAIPGLKKKKIDLIFSSDVLRTKETAEIVRGRLGIKKVFYDKRLRELNTGILAGKSPKDYHDYFSNHLEKFLKRPPEGENLTELRARMLSFLEDLEKQYTGKNILIVSHEYPLWMLWSGALGFSNEEALGLRQGTRKDNFINLAEFMELFYRKLPRDDNREVDLHRPYVDTFMISCPSCRKKMKRVPEVIDVWFDSGAMPFAQAHFPFSRKKGNAKYRNIEISKFLFPADFICEAVDQTRGWFYTLLAVATLLGKGAPYKNVISLGHVLDKNGHKMSKSKGNVVDPREVIGKYGADALRWYFYVINPPGEPKRFDEKDLQGKLRGFLMTLWNSFMLFDTYVDKIPNLKFDFRISSLGSREIPKIKIQNVLDHWVLTKLEALVANVTKQLDCYDITGAAREIENFTVNDFSQWYLRRSRRRFQRPESKKEKDEAAQTASIVLLILCKISAPFIPFLSEAIYQRLRRKMKLMEPSVHLEGWPTIKIRNTRKKIGILKEMEEVRKIVAEALKLRAERGIKVRQPLASLQILNPKFEIRNNNELLELIKDEVNVKEIELGDKFELDTFITAELKEEGMIREVVRNIQEMRKDLDLHPRNVIRLQFSGDSELDSILEKWKKIIVREANVREFVVGGKKIYKAERELDFEGKPMWVGIDPA